jgi:hypothetical protein
MIHVEERGTLDEGTADSLVRRLLRAGAHGRLNVDAGGLSCSIDFEPGRVGRISAGALSGAEALLRIAALASGEWTFDARGDQQEAELDDETLRMLGDLDRQMARWMRYVRRLGGLKRVLAVDEGALGASGLPGELRPFALEFDGEQSILGRILDSSMNDLTSLRLTSKLVEQSVLVDAAALAAGKPENTEAAAANWLDGNSGVFKSPFVATEEAVEESVEASPEEVVEEAVEDHFGQATELPTALPAEVDEGESPFQTDDTDSAPQAEATPEPEPEPEPEEEAEAVKTGASLIAEDNVDDFDAMVAAGLDDSDEDEPAEVSEPTTEASPDPFMRFDSPRDRIMAEVGEPSEEEAVEASESSDEASSDSGADDHLDHDWFDAGGEDPHDFEIDYHKSSSSKYYVIAILGFLGLGGYLMMNSSAPQASFNIDEQLVELDKLIDDRSCNNAKVKMAFIKGKAVKTAHKLAVQQREMRLKKCEKEEARMLQAKGIEPTVSVTGGEFSVETSKDMAARAIANAEGNAAIAYDQTVRLTTKTEKNFGRFVEFGEQIAIRLDDIRRTSVGEDGKFSVGLKLTIKARKKEIQYEMVSMKLRDNSEGQEQPRWWMSSASDGLVPVLGSGKLAKGRTVAGWVTFHGIDDKVKWPSLDYHPMWEPNAFAAGLADDLTADLSALEGDKVAEAKEGDEAKQPALKAPSDKPIKAKKKKKKSSKRIVTKRKRVSAEPRIVSKDPLAKARHYVKKRDSRRVLTEARRVLKSAPGNGEAHYLMGWAQVQMGTFQSARQSLSKATSLGAPPDAWYNLGLAYQMLGDDGKAIKALQRFVALAPGHKNAAMARETLEALQ